MRLYTEAVCYWRCGASGLASLSWRRRDVRRVWRRCGLDSNVCLLEMLAGFCCKEFSALSVTCQPVAVLFGDSHESSTLNHQIFP